MLRRRFLPRTRFASAFGVGLVLAVLGAWGVARADVATSAPCASGPGDHVAVVIDFGTARDAPEGVLAQCVGHTPGQRGLAALQAATTKPIGTDMSSKVCQIEGYPRHFDAGNCTAPKDGKISYWAYFHGSATGWSYSDRGSAAWRSSPEIVEGWRFVTVPAGSHSIPPPRNFSGGASFAWQSTCPAASPVPSATTRPRRPSAAPPSPPHPDSQVAPGRATSRRAQSGGSSGQSSASSVPPSVPNSSTSHPPSTVPGSSVPVEVESPSQRAGAATAPRLTHKQVSDANQETASGVDAGAILTGFVGAVVLAGVLTLAVWRSRRQRLSG